MSLSSAFTLQIYEKIEYARFFRHFFSQKRQNKDCTTVIWPSGGHDCEVCLISKWVILCRF